MAKLGQSTLGESVLGRPNSPQNPTIDDTVEDELTVSVDSVNFADEYKFYQAESSGSVSGDYTVVGSPTTTTYTDSPLEDGEKFYYRVSSVDGGSESNLSSEVSAVTILPVPSKPSLTLDSSGDIVVDWSNNDDSTDGLIDVEISTDGGSTWSTESSNLSTTTSSYTDTDVATNASYGYRIERVTDHAESTSADASMFINGTSRSPSTASMLALDSGSATELGTTSGSSLLTAIETGTATDVPSILGNSIFVLNESGTLTTSTGFTATSISSTNETGTASESSSLLAGHSMSVRDLFGPLESGSLSASGSTNIADAGLASETLQLLRPTTQDTIERGLAFERALSFVTSSFLTLEGSAGAQPEIMRMGASSQFSFIDTASALESQSLLQTASTSVSDDGRASDSPSILSTSTLQWNETGTARDAPVLTGRGLFTLIDTSDVVESADVNVRSRFLADTLGTAVDSGTSNVRSIVRVRNDAGLATSSPSTSGTASSNILESGSASDTPIVTGLMSFSSTSTASASEVATVTGRGLFTADSTGSAIATIDDIDVLATFSVDDRHVEFENGSILVTSTPSAIHSVDLPGRALFIGGISPSDNVTRREVQTTADMSSPWYTVAGVTGTWHTVADVRPPWYTTADVLDDDMTN